MRPSVPVLNGKRRGEINATSATIVARDLVRPPLGRGCSARFQAADDSPVQKICTVHGPAGVEVSAGTAAAGSRRDAGRFRRRPDTSR